MGINSLWAQQEIPMQIIDEMPAGAGNTLAPPRPWYITLEGQISMSGLNDGIYFLKVFRAQKGQALLRPFTKAFAEK